MKPKLVVLTGAGISAESGLKTFRDSDGLWEGYNVMEVATPEAWERNPVLVQQFYNERRAQVRAAVPNSAHLALADLESHFDVAIVTQNIDDLHERAGSSHVIHLHGIITYSQSDLNPELIYPINGDILEMGACCALGAQLRPHVVWFGEAVPKIELAANICRTADYFMLVGSSLAVYPAAGLLDYLPLHIPKIVVDPVVPAINRYRHIVSIQKSATAGVQEAATRLINYVTQ